MLVALAIVYVGRTCDSHRKHIDLVFRQEVEPETAHCHRSRRRYCALSDEGRRLGNSVILCRKGNGIVIICLVVCRHQGLVGGKCDVDSGLCRFRHRSHDILVHRILDIGDGLDHLVS